MNCVSCGKNTQISMKNYKVVCSECCKQHGLDYNIGASPQSYLIQVLNPTTNHQELWFKNDLSKKFDNILSEKIIRSNIVPISRKGCRIFGHSEHEIEGNTECRICKAVKWESGYNGLSEGRNTISATTGNRVITKEWMSFE